MKYGAWANGVFFPHINEACSAFDYSLYFIEFRATKGLNPEFQKSGNSMIELGYNLLYLGAYGYTFRPKNCKPIFIGSC